MPIAGSGLMESCLYQRPLAQSVLYQPCSGFELGSSIPFPMAISVSPYACVYSYAHASMYERVLKGSQYNQKGNFFFLVFIEFFGDR